MKLKKLLCIFGCLFIYTTFLKSAEAGLDAKFHYPGFMPGDRSFNSKEGVAAFNRLLKATVSKSSLDFNGELQYLQSHMKKNFKKHIPDNIRKIRCSDEITFNWFHIFIPEIKMARSDKPYPIVDGFHHDYQNTIQKSGIFDFSNIRMYEEGFYSANIHTDPDRPGTRFHKTFFPAAWDRRDVLDCILLTMQSITSEPKKIESAGSIDYKFKAPIKYKRSKKICTLPLHLVIDVRIYKGDGATSIRSIYPEFF